MKCSCGKPLPDPVIDLLTGAAPPISCVCGAVHTFRIPPTDDVTLFTQLNMANNITKPFGDRSPCPVCDEMMPSPIIEDGKATTTSCGNCGTRRTIQTSEDVGVSKPVPVPSDGKLWN